MVSGSLIHRLSFAILQWKTRSISLIRCWCIIGGHTKQFDADLDSWTDYNPDVAFPTNVATPSDRTVIGFDIVTYSMQNSPECSPLSCNHLATDVRVNKHCLIESLDYAIDRLEQGVFNDSEPGPYRIIEVNATRWPTVG